MALDVTVLLLLAIASVLGATSGALRQLVQLLGVGAGWLAARHLAAPVAAGLARSISPLLARAAASALLFAGLFALVTLVGGALLRGSGLAAVVRGPVDRGAGALLGGVKAAGVAWILLSALAVAGSAAPRGLALDPRWSQFAGLAARHNLLERLAPDELRTLERLRPRGDALQHLPTAPTPDAVRRKLDESAREHDRALRAADTAGRE